MFTEGFEGAPPTGRWARLVALEGMGVPDAAGADLARRVLVGDLDARSRRQALRALLVLRPLAAPRGLEVEDPGALLVEEGEGDIAGLGLELGLAGALPPAGWTPPSEALEDAAAVSELLVWAALSAEGGPRAGACPPWLVAVTRAALALEEERRRLDLPGPMALAATSVRGDLVRAFGALGARVATELSAPEQAALRTISLRAGLATAAVRQRALDDGLRALEEQRDDPAAVESAWLDLAAVVGDPRVGDLALETLQGSLVEALELRSRGPAGSIMTLRQAAEAACRTLDRARRDDLSERFSGELRRVATMGSHPLADLFLDEDWPPAPPLPPRDLERLSAPLPPR